MRKHILGLSSFAAIALLSLSAVGCHSSPNINEIHAPIVSESDKTSTGLETKWSRLTFGHYPSREIVASSFSNVDEYAYEEADVLVDPSLHKRLSEADWKEDKLTLGDISYERLLEPKEASSSQHYTYDDPGKKYHYFECEPIVWRVLSLDGSKATLMADKAMDCLTYHPNGSGASWKESYIRSYLNSLDAKDNETKVSFVGEGFYDKAFSAQEKKAILRHLSKESVNEDYDTSTGEASEDYVYILDQDSLYAGERAAEYGFFAGHGHDDPAKRFKSSMYAKFKGCWYSPVSGYRGNCFHFMRTPGYRQSYASYICDFGYIYSRGTSSDCFDAGVIPVIDADLSLASWALSTERLSSSIIQAQFGEDLSEDEPSTKWENVYYGEYPQEEVGEDDPRYATLTDLDWEDGEAYLDETRYKKVGESYFEYQPISWRILEKEADSALLFSNIGLDCHPFHDSLTNVNWSESEVRSFLNEDFLEDAFKEDSEAILEKKIENKKNYYFGTACGESTTDKVFLLSESDIFGEGGEKHGFAPSDATNDKGRQIAPTDYAIAKGAWTSKGGNGFFSLRTSGYSNANAVYVGELGDIYNRGIPVTCPDMTLVPAMWVDLSKIPSLTF